MKILIKDLKILFFYFLLATGVLYSSVKFHVPWYGSNDFAVYYEMVENPFNNNAGAPYGYRIFTPTIAHFVEQSGIFYKPNNTSFNDFMTTYEGNTFDSKTLYALIFTNYVLIVFSMFFLNKTLHILRPNLTRNQVNTFLPIGLILSTSTLAHGLNGLTEGGSLFIISLCCYLIYRNQLSLFIVAIIFGMFQRELIPLIFFIFCFFQKKTKYLIVSLLVFSLYFFIRYLFPLPGFEEQLELSAFIKNLSNFQLSKDFIFQVILSNNIILASLIWLSFGKIGKVINLNTISFMAIFSILLIISIGTGIGNNAGRILNMTTPFLLLFLPNFIDSVE